MTSNILKWINRYGPAEIIGTITALLGAIALQKATHNAVAAAYGGAWGENIGYYGTMVVKEWHASRSSEPGVSNLKRALSTVVNLVSEFGVAEVLDTLLLRPVWAKSWAWSSASWFQMWRSTCPWCSWFEDAN
jgi:hypothetical protein